MSTQPTDDESPPPTPTAQRSEGPIPSAVLDRRTFLRGTAAAGAAAIGGAGMASAEPVDEDVDYPDYAVGGNVSEWAHGLLDWGDDELDDPTADETNLHLQTQSQGEWYDEISVVSDNFLGDMRPVAHIDARDGISNAYLDGENASGGYDRALDRIATYYAARHQNEINAGLRTVTNFAHICDAARANDDVDDALLTLHCDRASVDEHCLGVVTTEFVDETFQLVGDHTFETKVPTIEFYEPDSDGLGAFIEEATLDDATIQDPTGEDWWDITISFNTEEEITTGGSWNLQNLPDYEDDDGDLEFPGIGAVFHMGEWVANINRIDNERASVQAEYDETLVDTLYQAFDDETISPSDVRGSVGLARHMGGTEDAYADSYRLALMMQLGLEQQDLENVASMTVGYSGATARNVTRDDDTDRRNIFPADFVQDQQYSGVLNARETPEQGIVTGETYVADGVLLTTDDADGSVVALEPVTMTEQWRRDDLDAYTVEMNESQSEAYAGVEGEFHKIDATTGETEWVYEDMLHPHDIALGDDEERVYFTDEADAFIACLDVADGTEIWRESPGFDPLSLHVEGDRIAVGSITREVAVFDTNGNRIWQNDPFGSGDSEAAYIHGDLALFGGDSDMYAYDLESGDQQWVYTTSDRPRDMQIVGGELHYCTLNEIAAVEWNGGDEPQEELWSVGETGRRLAVLPNHVIVTNSGDYYVLERDTGIEQEHRANEYGRLGGRSTFTDADGVLSGSLFFDSEEGEELQLKSGLIEIIEQTDSDGNEVEQSDTFTPEHDTNNVEDWTQTVEKHTTVYEETIVNNYETGDDGGDWWPSVSGDFGDGFGGQLAGIAVIAAIVVSVVWSVVSDAIPFLGN